MRNIVLFAIVITLFSSCAPRIVTVDRVRTEYVNRVRVDTIQNSDTVRIEKGMDTVRIEETKWRTRVTVLVDTIKLVDTLKIDNTDIKQIARISQENKSLRLKYKTYRNFIFGILIIALIVCVLVPIKRRLSRIKSQLKYLKNE